MKKIDFDLLEKEVKEEFRTKMLANLEGKPEAPMIEAIIKLSSSVTKSMLQKYHHMLVEEN